MRESEVRHAGYLLPSESKTCYYSKILPKYSKHTPKYFHCSPKVLLYTQKCSQYTLKYSQKIYAKALTIYHKVIPTYAIEQKVLQKFSMVIPSNLWVLLIYLNIFFYIIYAHCMLWYINRNVQYHESNVGYALAYTMHVKVHSTLLYQSTYMAVSYTHLTLPTKRIV